MKRRIFPVLALAALAACAPGAGAHGPRATDAPRAADLVLRGGRVVTMDPARPRVTAVAIAGGRVVRAGGDAEVSALVGPATRVVELGGRTVLPGLTDAHAHLYGLGASLDEVDLGGCASEDACAARVRGAPPERAWVLGRGWDQNKWADARFPSHASLDRVESARPVWLERVDGHAAWANARALALGGVTRATKDPPGGRIERGADGEPTGVLVDEAMDLVARAIPAPSQEERAKDIARAQRAALARGLTEVHEMGIDEVTVRAYRDLDARGALVLRVYAFALPAGGAPGSAEYDRVLAEKPDPKESRARFKLRGIKIIGDGALGSRGAALLAPYADAPDARGTFVTPPDVVEHVAARARETGWQIAVHAIGDRTNRAVLDAYARAGVRAEDRFRVEHAQIVDPADIPRFAAMGVLASMQPTHATSDMPWAEARLGRARLAGAYAWRSFLRAGVRVLGGSDFPVESPDPVLGLFAAVTRTDARGNPPGGWLPDQRMTLDEAIAAFTVEAAYGAFEETWRGRIAEGYAADLTVLDRDVLDDPPRALNGARAEMTIVGGVIAFDARK